MVRREMRIPEFLDSQIRRQAARLQEEYPESTWSESGVVRWCLALGMQGALAAEARGQAPGCGPDLSRAIENAWAQWDEVFGPQPRLPTLDEDGAVVPREGGGEGSERG